MKLGLPDLINGQEVTVEITDAMSNGYKGFLGSVAVGTNQHELFFVVDRVSSPSYSLAAQEARTCMRSAAVDPGSAM